MDEGARFSGTDDPLRWGVSADWGGCWVDEVDGNDCGDTPMRVCVPGSGPEAYGDGVFDRLGNSCNWTDCGYEDIPPPNYFYGGCSGDPTAGTLCCS